VDYLDRELLSTTPCQEYLALVKEKLLRLAPDKLPSDYDPFALRPAPLPADQNPAAYIVDRYDVTVRVYGPRNHIISGRAGVGKTVLWYATHRSPRDDFLAVPLSTSRADLGHNPKSLAEGELLLSAILPRFWQELATQGDRIDFTCPDPGWLPILCWFYQHYPPAANLSLHLEQHCCDEPLLSTDLLGDLLRLVKGLQIKDSLPFNQSIRNDLVNHFNLNELADLCMRLGENSEQISAPSDLNVFAREMVGHFGRRGRLPELFQTMQAARPGIRDWATRIGSSASGRTRFGYIRLFIHADPTPSVESLCRLINHAVGLSIQYTGLYWTVFVSDRVETELHHFGATQRSWPDIFHLPDWREAELKELLLARMRAPNFERSGEYQAPNTARELLQGMPDRTLTRAAQECFLDIVVENATRACGRRDPVAAPVHALNLTRILLTACTGRWRGFGFDLPLAPEHLKKLCNHYWRAREESWEEQDA
jgi:hypothetical protein